MSLALQRSTQPRHAGHLLEYEVEDELTLYDTRAQVVHILNPTAAAVWRLADGTLKAADIVSELAEIYGLEADVVEEDVQDILEQFREAGLLQNRNGMASRR